MIGHTTNEISNPFRERLCMKIRTNFIGVGVAILHSRADNMSSSVDKMSDSLAQLGKRGHIQFHAASWNLSLSLRASCDQRLTY